MHEERLALLLKGLRQKQHLSQEGLAARIGVHRNVVARWERHPYGMRIQVLARWCQVLGEPLSKIVLFVENPPNRVQEQK